MGTRRYFLSAITALALAGCSSSPQVQEARYLRRGESLLIKKDYQRALLEFKNAAKAMPKDAEPLYQAGLAYLAANDVASAVAAFRHATELNPGHTRAKLIVAQLMTGTGDKDLVTSASVSLRELLRVSPDDVEIMDTLALAEWRLGQTADAQKLLDRTLEKIPGRLQSSVALARLKMSQGDPEGAENALKNAVESAPEPSHASLALGQLYLVLKKPQSAEPFIRKALDLDSKSGPALIALAAIQTADKRLNEAEETYKRLAALPEQEYKSLHALFLYNNGKRDLALPEFERLSKSNPDDRDLRRRLLAAYNAMGKTAEAKRLLDGALKRNPKDVDLLFERGALSLDSGRTVEAETDLSEVLHFKPDSADAHFALALIHNAKGLRERERQDLNDALKFDPTLLNARLRLAKSLLLSNEARSSLDILDQAPDSQKSRLAVVSQRNWALLATGNSKDLRRVLDETLPKRRFPELVLQEAILRIGQGDHAGARADAQEVLRAIPDDARAVRVVADSYLGQKNATAAEKWLTETVNAHSKSAPLQHLLGQWHMSARNLTEARKAFEAEKAAGSDGLQADLSLAEIDRLENRTESACQRLEGVLSASPTNIPAMILLADIEGKTGRNESSIRRYRSVLDINGSNPIALNNLAYALAVKSPDEALKYAQRATELAPDNTSFRDTLGWVYYQKGIYSSAVTYLKAAATREPSPRRQFHLAMAYLKSGERTLGQKMLRTALQQDPNLQNSEQGW